jgi:hypothetical protein
MISSVDMEASWSSSASSTAIAAGAGADDDINRLSARNGGVRVGWGFVAAALDLLWKKMRSRRVRCAAPFPVGLIHGPFGLEPKIVYREHTPII